MDAVQCQQQLRAAQRKLGRHKQRHWGLTPRLLRILMLILLRSGFDEASAEHFAVAVRKQRKRRCLAESSVPVMALFHAWPLDSLISMIFPETEAGKREYQHASVFLAELATAQWVRSMNFDHGVAPDVRTLLTKYNDVRRQNGLDACQALTRALAHESSVGPRMSPYGRQWAQRFRKRWDLKRKKLQQTFRLDVDSLVARAAGLSLRLTFVCFIAFKPKIVKCPGQFWVQEMALFWGRAIWFSIAGFCFGGSKLRPDSFSTGWIGVSSRRNCKVMSRYG